MPYRTSRRAVLAGVGVAAFAGVGLGSRRRNCDGSIDTNATTSGGEPKLEVPPGEATIGGSSTCTAGKELYLKATDDDDSPFFKTAVATVEDDGSWAATMDFGDQPTGTTFDLKLSDGHTLATLDHCEVVENPPTPTPTPTPTDSPTPTATDSPSPTATSSPTPTATDSPSPTATSSPTPTATDSPTPTATDSRTPTATGETADDTPTATTGPSTESAVDDSPDGTGSPSTASDVVGSASPGPGGDGTDASAPGFGLVAAVIGLGGVLWLRRRE